MTLAEFGDSIFKIFIAIVLVSMCISQYMQDEKERKRNDRDDQH